MSRRTVASPRVCEAPYGEASPVRRARTQRDLPFHDKDGVNPDATLLKGSRVDCTQIGHRTWICRPGLTYEWAICNTRDLTFIAPVTMTSYRRTTDFAPAESTHWATQARKSESVRWARRVLARFLAEGPEATWTEKTQSTIDGIITDLDRVAIRADLLRAVNAAPYGAVRKAKVLTSIDPVHADLWWAKAMVCDGYIWSSHVVAGIQQRILDALIVLLEGEA